MKCEICFGESKQKRCKRCVALITAMERCHREAFPFPLPDCQPHAYYRLSAELEPIPCTFAEWSVFMSVARMKRVVKREWVGYAEVSTVFLGLDHSFGRKIPILWETMVFSNRKDLNYDMERCGGSREQAEAMHARMVARVAKSEGVKISK